MNLRGAGLSLVLCILLPLGARGQNVYVSNAISNSVSVINAATGTVTSTIPVYGPNEGVGVTPDGSQIFVVQDSIFGTVTAIAAATSETGFTIDVGVGPRTVVVTPDGKKAYVTNSLGAGTISVFDTSLYTVTDTISDSGFAVGEAMSADGSTLYVANQIAGTVSIVSTASNSVVGTITIGASAQPIGVVLSPNGKTLYVSGFDNSVAVVDLATNTVRQKISVGNIDSPYAGGIAITPNGKTLYVADMTDGTVSAISTASNSVIATIHVGKQPVGVAITPDGGKVFVANYGDGTVSVINVATNTVTEAPIQVGSGPNGIAIGATPPPSPLVAAVLPGSRSVQTNAPATVFATILNTGATPLANCRIAVGGVGNQALNLDYQTTDPTTNALTGTIDQPVAIPAHGSQTFVLTFSEFFSQQLNALPLNYSCDGVSPAVSIVGVNTVDLSFSSTPTPDIVALGATLSGDGILDITGTTGSAAFAVATSNLGATATITATADTGGAVVPMTLTICQTFPATGQCLAPPAASVSPVINAGDTPTFSIFATASGNIPLSPAVDRIFVRFKDYAGVTRGSTSVAVRTQ